MPTIAAAFGIVPLQLIPPWLGAGFIVGGLATTVAGALALSDLRSRPGPLRTAAGAAIPLGLSLGLYGAVYFADAFPQLRSMLLRSMRIVLPIELVLATVVVVSLLIGLVRTGDDRR